VGKEELNTSLASWTDLKHDAIYTANNLTEQNAAVRTPPDPYTVGYVEPNVNFWKEMISLLKLTENMLKKNEL